MNNTIFEEIKKKALENHIPIIMDDTLEFLDNMLIGKNIDNILEIGTAVRLFCYMLFEIPSRKWENRHNRKRNR